MAERVTGIAVSAFRGVPGDFAVDLPRGQSLLVLGENGTGKSTIADALEWYFTGGIDFLRHEGRQHAVRHVGAVATQPTLVRIGTTGALGGTRELEGAKKSLDIEDIATRETFILRGRTLVAFVEKSKAEKWKALTQILGLDAVDQYRLDLQRAKNELEDDAAAAAHRLRIQTAAVARDLDMSSDDTIVGSLSQRCREAGVQPPKAIEECLGPSWVGHFASDEDARRLAEARALISELRAVSAQSHLPLGPIEHWNRTVSPEASALRTRLDLGRAANAYLRSAPSEDHCPVCGQSVDAAVLRDHVANMLQDLELNSAVLLEAERGIDGLLRAADELERRCRNLASRARGLGLEAPAVPMCPVPRLMQRRKQMLDVDAGQLDEFLGKARSWLETMANATERATPEDADGRQALISLGAVITGLRTWHQARRDAEMAARAARLAELAFSTYQEKQRAYFAGILSRISDRVATLYGRLHPDEGLGDVCIEPWSDKGVELAVDFHGKRQKPPHGVLSESHLNSLAIALFLAMAETFNERFGFLVLDDVVNSFDSEHRAALAKVLTSEFAEWQLIVLTHDSLFYEHIRRRAPAWAKREFTSWSYESGPRGTEYQTGSMLEKAQRCLPDDKTGAAQKGRKALEEFLQETCEAIGAPLAFRRGRANDIREPGELFAGLRRGLKRDARELLRSLEPLLTDLEADLQAALNVEAHASRGQVSAIEIRQALDRIAEFEACFTCSSCQTRVWHTGTPAASACQCRESVFPPPARVRIPDVGGVPR